MRFSMSVLALQLLLGRGRRVVLVRNLKIYRTESFTVVSC